MNLRPHQYNALFIAFGIILGACLHYFFFRNNLEYVKDKAYQEGFVEGRDSTTRQIIKGIYESDSIIVTENEIRLYYK